MDLGDVPRSGNGHGRVTGYLPLPPVGPAAPPPVTADPRFYLRMLRKRGWVVVLFVVVAVSAAAVYVSTQPRVYRATAYVQVLQPAQVLVLSSSGKPQMQRAMSTEAKNISSSITAAKACEILRRSKESAVGTAPPAGSAGTGQSSAGASDAAPAEDEREVTTPEILSSLSVTVENPDILRVSIENESADRAKRIADAVVDAYLERSREAASEEAAKGEEFLLRQMEALKHDMERIEADTRKFKTSHNIRDPNLDSLVGPSAILDYSTEAERAQTDLQAAAAELASLQRRLQKESPVRVVRKPVNDPLAIGMRQAVTDAEVELAKLQAQYQDAHPLVRHQKAKLAELRAQLAAYDKPQELVESTEPNPMYEALQARIRDQQTAVESLRVRASMLAQLAAKKLAQKPPNSPDAFVGLARLQHAREIAEKTYVGLLERLQELKIQKASEVGYARRLDWAQRPTYPIRPAPKRTLAMAAMIGLMLGVSVVFLMACTDTSVSDPKELLQRTGMVALGFIPEGSRREVSAVVAAAAPKGAIAEGFRRVRSHLMSAYHGEALRSLAITSTRANEGKSLVSANLAVVFAQLGWQVLLVDTDLRRPSLHRVFGMEASPGVTELLVGEAQLDSAIRATSVPNLLLLPSGAVAPHPSELLSSPAMEALVSQLTARVDLVVFDTPPALMFTDAEVLAPRMDGVVVVVEQGKASSEALTELRELIERARGRVAGAVLNKVKPMRGDYYYRHYHYADYGHYYDSDRKATDNGAKAVPAAVETTTAAAQVASGDEERDAS